MKVLAIENGRAEMIDLDLGFSDDESELDLEPIVMPAQVPRFNSKEPATPRRSRRPRHPVSRYGFVNFPRVKKCGVGNQPVPKHISRIGSWTSKPACVKRLFV